MWRSFGKKLFPLLVTNKNVKTGPQCMSLMEKLNFIFFFFSIFGYCRENPQVPGLAAVTGDLYKFGVKQEIFTPHRVSEWERLTRLSHGVVVIVIDADPPSHHHHQWQCQCAVSRNSEQLLFLQKKYFLNSRCGTPPPSALLHTHRDRHRCGFDADKRPCLRCFLAQEQPCCLACQAETWI